MTTIQSPAKYVIPVGTSEPQDFGLLNDGEALDGTGFTIGMEIFRLVDGVMVPVTETGLSVAWLSQSGGTVSVTGVEALIEGKYFVRYTITNVANDLGYVPNGRYADFWDVVPIPAR